MKTILTLILMIMMVSCKKEIQPKPEEKIYFPPLTGSEWQTASPSSVNFNETELNNLYTWLNEKNTKAFIILVNGKIVAEKYFGTFTCDSNWYWASAGKTMTAMLVGIAQQKGLLSIYNRSSQYLGTGWTSLPSNKEDSIRVRHQLTMTTGLDDGVTDPDCTLPSCLTYLADAGTRWAYHNAAYTLLDKVVETASGMTYNSFFQQNLRDRIGMNGIWIKTPNANNVFYSTPRSAARFGLLMLNKGKWDTTAILNDAAYFDAMVNSSQTINPSYGYLTWLNGKSSYKLPGTQLTFSGSVISTAPADMYAALGKNDQKIYVIPSKKMVVVRMGNAAGGSVNALSGFDVELWSRMKNVVGF